MAIGIPALRIAPTPVIPVRTRDGEFTSSLHAAMKDKLALGRNVDSHREPTVKRSTSVYTNEKSYDYSNVVFRVGSYFKQSSLDPTVESFGRRLYDESIIAPPEMVFQPFTKIMRWELQHHTLDELKAKYGGNQYKVTPGKSSDVLFEVLKLGLKEMYWKMGGSHYNFNEASGYSGKAVEWASEGSLSASLQAFHIGVIAANGQPRAMETVYKDFLHSAKHFTAAGMKDVHSEIYNSLVATAEPGSIASFMAAKSLPGSAIQDGKVGRIEGAATNFEMAIASAKECFYPEVRENVLFVIADAMLEAAANFAYFKQEKRLAPLVQLLKTAVDAGLPQEAKREMSIVLQNLDAFLERTAPKPGQPLADGLQTRTIN